jgi:hypothetical protein
MTLVEILGWLVLLMFLACLLVDQCAEWIRIARNEWRRR